MRPARLLMVVTTGLMALGLMAQGGVALAGGGVATRQPEGEALPRIPVAAVTIYPGEVITAAMLRMRPVPRWYYRRGGFLANPRDIIGKMARRTLVRNRPVPPNALREPFAVRSGKAVRLVYRRGGLEISALGTALSSVSAGEVVAVRNVDSGRIVHGVAQADGTVLVGGAGMR